MVHFSRADLHTEGVNIKCLLFDTPAPVLFSLASEYIIRDTVPTEICRRICICTILIKDALSFPLILFWGYLSHNLSDEGQTVEYSWIPKDDRIALMISWSFSDISCFVRSGKVQSSRVSR